MTATTTPATIKPSAVAISPEHVRALKHMSADEGKTMQALTAEAIELLIKTRTEQNANAEEERMARKRRVAERLGMKLEDLPADYLES